MGGFNPAGAPNTVYYPLGLVTTPQNAFWTMLQNAVDPIEELRTVNGGQLLGGFGTSLF